MSPWHPRIQLFSVAVLIFLTGQATMTGAAQHAQVGLHTSKESGVNFVSVEPSGPSVKEYEAFELTIKLDRSFENPFDPRQINVFATFEGPNAAAISISGFYYQDYRLWTENGIEHYDPVGDPIWNVRFVSPQEGRYVYQVTVETEQDTALSEQGSFEVVQSERPGFIRVSSRDPRYFEFDSGAPYMAIGHNVCWTTPDQLLGKYEAYFSKMAAHGENWTRLWMIHWNVGLEWSKEAGYPGLGRYDLLKAWLLDRILEMAEEQGIYVMLCLDSFNTLRISPEYPAWDGNPYGAHHGGPIERPEQFFTNEEAHRLYRQRLRYVIARYAHSPSVMAWELWNEVDIIATYRSKEVAAWHREMARYVRDLDPYDHLVTTSFANPKGDPAIWDLPEIEVVQSHEYGPGDKAASIRRWCLEKQAYPKPHVFGEFGTDWLGGGNETDPDGVNIHNAIWAAVHSGAAGTAMSWWWDNYIDPMNLYYHYAALAQFTQGMDGPGEHFRDLRVGKLAFVEPPENQGPADVEIAPGAGWGRAPTSSFEINAEGRMTPDAFELSRFLYGAWNRNFKNPPTFHVDYPVDGMFVVHVNTVSDHANLQVTVDGVVRLSEALPTGPGEGPWKEAVFNSKWGIYQNVYDRDYAVSIPKGPHTLRIENTEGDWISVDEYRFTNVRTIERPALRVMGLQGRSVTLLWIQNIAHTWSNVANGEPVPPVSPCTVELIGLKEGQYRVEGWDTYTGRILDTSTATCRDGVLLLTLPEVRKDMAIKLFRMDQTGVEEETREAKVESFTLLPGRPNPFNHTTTLTYILKQNTTVRLDIYDLLGRHIVGLVNSRCPVGRHYVRWNGRDASGQPVGSGVYLCYMKAGRFSSIQRLLLLK